MMAIDEPRERQLRARKIKTALVLVSIAVAFFVGVIVRHWTLQ
jgi:hypothetical protein